MLKGQKDWLERPRTIRWLWLLLWVICGLTLVPELFIHREAHFGIDRWYAFYALLGFVACALLILVAKLLGFVLKRKEDYYD